MSRGLLRPFSMPHVFSCPFTTPRHRRASGGAAANPPPASFNSFPNPPLIHHLFGNSFMRKQAAKRETKGAASTNSCCLLLQLQLTTLPLPRRLRSVPIAICDFFGGKGKQARRGNTPQIPLTYRSNPSIHRAESISPSFPHRFPFLPLPLAAGSCVCARVSLAPLDPPAPRGPVERRSGRSGVGWALVLLVSWPFLVGILSGLFLLRELFLFSVRSKSLLPSTSLCTPIQFIVDFGAARASSTVDYVLLLLPQRSGSAAFGFLAPN